MDEYSKNNYKNNSNCEVNNRENFFELLKILRLISDNLDMYFSIISSGMCKIIKKNESQLNEETKVLSQTFSIKNTFRKILSK